jgi:cell division ATPase FtsA
MPVRVAAPSDIGGLVDGLLQPDSATAIGLLLWGARHVAASEMTTYDSAPGGGLAARFRNALRSIFP